MILLAIGFWGEKKLAEKTEAEVKTETGAIAEIRDEVRKLSKMVAEIKEKQK